MIVEILCYVCVTGKRLLSKAMAQKKSMKVLQFVGQRKAGKNNVEERIHFFDRGKNSVKC
jgi:hypothetical protein